MKEAKTVLIHVVWTNTDLTEGKGQQIPIAYSELYSTAARLASKKGVQGSDAEVQCQEVFRVGHTIYAPVRMEPATEIDKAREKVRIERAAAIEKARAAGLTEEELRLIATGAPR